MPKHTPKESLCRARYQIAQKVLELDPNAKPNFTLGFEMLLEDGWTPWCLEPYPEDHDYDRIHFWREKLRAEGQTRKE